MSDSQPASANRAVFLSYASQDAEAARRICESLRAGGVEVWFDADGGLEHGDEWDAKIRRQIKECVLFIPLISANTQARHEGYFRLEWDLAAERARTIASGVPFILPVVIDDTREPDALVPDRFRTVQWTKLRGGEVSPDVQQRFLKLWSHRSGLLKSKLSAGPSPEAQPPAPASPPSSKARWPLVLGISAAVFAIGIGGFVAIRPGEPPVLPPAVSKATAPPPQPALSKRYAASRPEIAALLRRVQAMTDKADVARAGLETSLSLLDQAARLDSADANVWAERALVEYRYVTYNLDNTPARIDAALQHAKQATSLDPKNPNARLADALTQLQAATNQASRDAAAGILESLVAEGTDRPDAYFALANLKFRNRKPDEAFALLDRAAQIPGTAGRATLEKAFHFASSTEQDWRKANEALDQALSIERSAQALLWKSYLASIWLGDAALAKQAIADIPPGMLTEDFPASGKLFVALLAHDWEGVIATMRAVPRNYLGSGALSGPTGYYVGYALARAGRKSAAEIEWRSALEVVNKRFESDPRSRTLFTIKALLLAALGDRAGAEKTLQTLRELYPNAWARTWEGHMLAMELLPPEEAIAQLADPNRFVMAACLVGGLKLDPFVDHLRSHPKFAELLARAESDPKLNPHAAPPPAEGSTAAPPVAAASADKSAPADKSVAVLAFADNSPGRDSEYFSDGISEELINALGKVPGLKVPARTSSFHFKGKDTPIPEIAKQLGVAYVIEGSVQRAGDKIKISARLSNAADGFQVWTDSFLRDAKDVFAVEEEIAGLIAKQLSLKLGVSSAAATASVNPEAFELYVKARRAWSLRIGSNLNQAENFLNQALTIEPKFARAHAALADVWLARGEDNRALSRYGQRTSPEFGRIAVKIKQALALDPDSAEAHASLGRLSFDVWDFDAADRELRRSILLNNNIAPAHQWLGRTLEAGGQMDEALEEVKRATELDPLAPILLVNYAGRLWQIGRFAESLALCDRCDALQPGINSVRNRRVGALISLGRTDEALALTRQVNVESSGEWSFMIRNLAAAGAKAEAAALLAKAPDDLLFPRPLLLLGLDRRDEALVSLNPKDWSSNSVGSIFFDPLFDSIRGEPRFAKFLADLGLTDAHARAQAWRKAHPPEKPVTK